MTMRARLTYGSIGLLVAIAAVWLWSGAAPGESPDQPPLRTLDAASLQAFRSDFNRDADRVRVIALLSPT